jgi:protein kinase A
MFSIQFHVCNTGNTEERVGIEFKDLKPLAVLGAGTFGRVSLVQHTKTKEVYALKALIKAEIVMHKQQSNVVQEKNVMIQSNHPFILRLFTTFRDTTKLYMLLEFVQGGELFSVIHTNKSDGVPAAQAKFYGAGVLLGLAYLHSKDIAYRDMKPENCLVDKDGYPKVVDFGFAKIIKNSKTYTLCGTPEYLAPEIVLGRGHDKSVDYWAFGILLYEMIAGYSPFSDPQVSFWILVYELVLCFC